MASASGPKASKHVENGTTVAMPKVTPVPIPKPGTIPSMPPSAAQAAAAARAQAQGFGVLKPAESGSFHEAGSLPKDGRVRNPVPSKLKGKTDNVCGSFGVMHMDTGVSEAADRVAEAKKTSESTEQAALRAYASGYTSHKRTRFLYATEDEKKAQLAPAPPPPAPAPTLDPAYGVAPLPYIPPTTPGAPPGAGSKPGPTRRVAMTPAETKAEQARLLTLLRSLQPLQVADQICKALAFFGGIPGAPPPDNGVFPNSAEANGSGSLFVGWIAEIFPRLGQAQPALTESPGQAHTPAQVDVKSAEEVEATVPQKRKRGRPKGSKSTKARKDKGIKKGPLHARGRPLGMQGDQGIQGSHPDESWADVDDVADETDDVDANVMLLAQEVHAPTSMHPPSQAPLQAQTQPQPPTQPLHSAPAVQTRPMTNAPAQIESAPSAMAESAPTVRKRGRPKGSKNRPKDATAAAPSSKSSSVVTQSMQANMFTNKTFTPVNDAMMRKRATKTKVMASSTTESQPSDGVHNAHGESQALATAHMPQSTPLMMPITAIQNSTPMVNGSTPASAKRKRQSAKAPDEYESQQTATTEHASGVFMASPQVDGGLTLPTPPANSHSAKLATEPPSAKRQRRTKEKKVDEVAGKATNSGASAAGVPPPLPSPASVPASGPGQPAGSTPQLVQQSVSSMPSPQHNHFDMHPVHSPAMENYEAQLQAQLEQQVEPESQAASTQKRVDSRHVMSSQMKQQQQQQQHQSHNTAQQYQMQQRQQATHSQQSTQQHVQSHQTSTSHSHSPDLQQQGVKSQSASPMVSHQIPRAQNHYSHYRASTNQFNPQSYSPQQNHQQAQSNQQQKSPQPPTQALKAQHQQYATSATQAQYSNNTQQYSPSPSFSSKGLQQQTSAQPRYSQQLNTGSGGAASYAASHSPQYASSGNEYRASTGVTTSSSYAQSQRNQSVTPTATNPYRTSGNSHTPSAYNTSGSLAASTTQQHQHQAHRQQQQQQQQQSHHQRSSTGLGAAMPSYSASPGTSTSDWTGMFDTTATLETPAGSYAMGRTATSTSGSAFAASAASLNGAFDTSRLQGAEHASYMKWNR